MFQKFHKKMLGQTEKIRRAAPHRPRTLLSGNLPGNKYMKAWHRCKPADHPLSHVTEEQEADDVHITERHRAFHLTRLMSFYYLTYHELAAEYEEMTEG